MKSDAVRFAGVKLRALLLARGLRAVDLADERPLSRAAIPAGSFLKHVNCLIHGKAFSRPDDPRLRVLATVLRVPLRFLADDAAWSAPGLSALDLRALDSLRSLHEWYIRHAGPESAYKFLGLDFDALQRQSQILQGICRSYGEEPLIQTFVGIDHEEGRFDREFAALERLASRNRGIRTSILAYVWDVPVTERRAGREFLPLRLGDCELEVGFTDDLPRDRADVRYLAVARRGRRRLWIRGGVDDFRLAFILAREVAIHLMSREGFLRPEPYAEHHWPCAIDSYELAKAHVLQNRLAAALLLPREILKPRIPRLLCDFGAATLEEACRALGCAPETLLLRIVQLQQRQAHFLRIDADGPEGPFTLKKLYCGNGLPVRNRVAARGPFPPAWGVMKSLARFFREGSAASRHVQVTRLGREKYVCLSLSYPGFEGGAKAVCIGYRLEEFRGMFGGLPKLTEKKPSVDLSSSEIDWGVLGRLERATRFRGLRPKEGEGAPGGTGVRHPTSLLDA